MRNYRGVIVKKIASVAKEVNKRDSERFIGETGENCGVGSNVGKSALINRLVGEEKHQPRPG